MIYIYIPGKPNSQFFLSIRGLSLFFGYYGLNPKYAHIRFEGSNFGNLEIQSWCAMIITCVVKRCPPHPAQRAAPLALMPGYPVMICDAGTGFGSRLSLIPAILFLFLSRPRSPLH